MAEDRLGSDGEDGMRGGSRSMHAATATSCKVIPPDPFCQNEATCCEEGEKEITQTWPRLLLLYVRPLAEPWSLGEQYGFWSRGTEKVGLEGKRLVQEK